ncbi:major facilitator superfamily domain-containing protein [Xylariomycetidae sp. FL0641]|nr:major facilitator superfamily domain-containing protein [Xylariomycetidae sp. FL0641]
MELVGDSASSLPRLAVPPAPRVKESREELLGGAKRGTDDDDVVLVAAAASDGAYPEGGREAWLTVLGAWFCFFSSFGFITSSGVFQDYYEHALLAGYSPSQISWIPSLQLFALSGLAPFAGMFFDGHGPRLLVALGSFLVVFGTMMQSLATEYYQVLLSQSVCAGLGMSMIFHGSTNSIPTWFKRRRGLAMGLASSGSGLGGVVLPIMFDRLLTRIGYAWTVRTIAFLLLPLQLVAIFTIRSRLVHTPKGFHLLRLLRPFKDTVFALNASAVFFGILGLPLPLNFLKEAGEAAGIKQPLSTYLLPILNSVSILGRIVPLWAGDHFGIFNVATVLIFYGAILVLGLWYPAPGSTNTVIAFSALYGAPLGFFLAAVATLAAQISDIREIGVRVGATFLVNGIAGLISNPLGGSLIGVGGRTGPASFDGLKLFCGLSILVSGCLFATTRIYHGGWNLAKI